MHDGAPVPAADPRAAWRAQAAAIEAAMRRVLESGRYILGPEVEAFEREWAAYCGAAEAVGVASGTDAIELALRAVGVAPGDVVVTAANTTTATAAAIERAGARLAVAEIDPLTMNLSVPALAAWLESRGAPRVRAVVAVHLYGNPADLPALLELGKRHGFAVIEDAAQAHGARIADRRVGAFGVAGAFSFYPTKNLGAIGDGGAVTTSDAALAARVRSLRQYGWKERYVAAEVGMNSRLDELQAAILRVKLATLDAANARRRAIAARYSAELASCGWRLPQATPGAEPVWHQYVVRHPARDALRRHLERAGVQSAVLYPVPLHEEPAWRGRVVLAPGGLHEAARACREVLALPVHPELSDAEVGRVIAAAAAFAP